ncbi:MAG: hypothetical protein J6B24_02535 [Clostridia bacterium]|nr:hypothetical protein [Clostridia bacterium]
MNQLLNNRVGKTKKSGNRKGCLFLIVGSLVALLATGLYVLAVSYLTGVIIEARHGEGVAYAIMNIVTPSYGIAMLCFYGILAIWYFTPTEEEVKKQNQGLAPMLGQKQRNDALPKRTLWLITAGLLLAVPVTGTVAVNSYKLITPDGVSTYFFAETKSYQWKQVTGYTIDSDDNNGLSVTFTMRDGKQIEILQGVNSTTERFDEQYTSVTHFAAELDDDMVALQVPRNVKHMERSVKLYKDTTLWPYVSRLIGYVELVPEPDETVAETRPETEAVTDGETGS